jgi:hypothetical protein
LLISEVNILLEHRKQQVRSLAHKNLNSDTFYQNCEITPVAMSPGTILPSIISPTITIVHIPFHQLLLFYLVTFHLMLYLTTKAECKNLLCT